MAEYRISGVWKKNDGIITHYAFHTVEGKTASRAEKISKTNAINLVETQGNIAVTWIWDYKIEGWKIGETVHVVNSQSGKYLRSNPDNTLTDNLEHLIDFDWIAH